MDWVERMNEAINYVEDNLTGVVSEDALCKITACSFSLFQGTFSQVTGVSLAEYIRRRRLSDAAYALLNTEEKVIDIAMKYGYGSSDAFCVAFKRLHGVTPTVARRAGTTITFYCRVTFSLTIKGVDKMDYALLEQGPFKVVGVRRTTPYGGGTWAVVKSDGGNDKIKALSGRFYDLGLCFGFLGDGSNDYMCAIQWDGEDIEDLDSYEYPAASWLKFEAKGKISDQVLGGLWRRINDEFLPQGKYQKSGLPTIERYVSWDEAADTCQVEVWIPVAAR